MVWARGDLNFEVVALRTMHNMNVKQGVVLQQLIAKELIVADALADACAQFNRGDLTTREKRMLRRQGLRESADDYCSRARRASVRHQWIVY